MKYAKWAVLAGLALSVLGATEAKTEYRRGNRDSSLIRFASAELVASCDAIVERIRGGRNPHHAERNRVTVKDDVFFTHQGRELRAVLLGCGMGGAGEVIIIDSTTQPSRVHQIEINLASMYANLGGIRDVNGDGIPELFVNIASGSHGMYLTLVSIHQDSLALITNSRGHYEFFGSGGAVNVKDLDGDGIDEIVLTEMVWGHDTLADPSNPPKTVLRWQDGHYVESRRAEDQPGGKN